MAMKAIWKNEWNRVFFGKEFAVTMLIGGTIAIWHFLQYVYQMEWIEIDVPVNLYVSWMGANSYRMQSYWYYMIFPLLAVMPFVGKYYDDWHSGYVKNVLLRCSRKAYFKMEGTLAFLAGGIGVTAPLVLNLVLTAMVRPALRPDPYVAIGPLTYCYGSELYYAHPFIYTVLYLGFDFFVGGIIALAAMILCDYVNYKFVVLVIPYGIFYLLHCIGIVFGTNTFSPNAFLIPGIGIESVYSLVMVILVSVVVLFAYAWKGKKYEG